MSELPKTYDARAAEARWYAEWLEKGLFHGEAAAGGTPFCMVIPPPNVTGILHIGHALNNTLQDVLLRWRRMQGRNAIWVPGTDHAGIATQNVVERALKKEGRTRDDLGREEFLRRVWDWKTQYGDTIIRQLKKIGAACDWPRERFTMDEGLSRAVTEVFCRLYDEGLIYRGHYIINWCPRCGTALSDEESEHRPTRGKLYYIRYPIADEPGRFVVVATTRPETLLGDVAVAVNPRDPRYAAHVGRELRLPVLGRALPVIADDFVAPEFGTGAVKVTPAHDPNDFDMGRRHGLTPIVVMDGQGRMNEGAGPYAGQDRFACRKQIVADLEAAGLLEKIEDHDHAVGHCYRCDCVVEPRLSPQWFVKMKPLAQPALEAVRSGRIRFVPERWNKVYTEWMENIRDWCISRQIWWGHRIPVYTCAACEHEWAARAAPGACPTCGAGADRLRQDPDVLDTWFSSWLWPFSVFGWPEENADLKFYYPTQTLCTASEIIFFWVARMVMAGCKFMGDIPFDTVYIHGTVRDPQGRKMSKSLGNSVDPLTIVEKYGADALRASLMLLTATGQDVYISDEKFELGRNFGTKIWNAARFMQLHGATPPPDWAAPVFTADRLTSDDRHLLAKLDGAIAAATENLERFRFNDYAHTLYDFLWHDYCDWYVEYAKDILYGDDAARREHTRRVMHHVFSTALRLLHPLMPFLSEELWHGMGYGGADEYLLRAAWPAPRPADERAALGLTPDVVAYVDAKHELIRAARTLKSDLNIPPKQAVEYVVRPADAAAAAGLARDQAAIVALLRAARLEIASDFAPPRAMPSAITPLGTLYMSIAGVLDAAAERRKLEVQAQKNDEEIERIGRKLSDENFTRRAPAEVVAQQEARRRELREKGAKLRELIAMLAAE